MTRGCTLWLPYIQGHATVLPLHGPDEDDVIR